MIEVSSQQNTKSKIHPKNIERHCKKEQYPLNPLLSMEYPTFFLISETFTLLPIHSQFKMHSLHQQRPTKTKSCHVLESSVGFSPKLLFKLRQLLKSNKNIRNVLMVWVNSPGQQSIQSSTLSLVYQLEMLFRESK